MVGVYVVAYIAEEVCAGSGMGEGALKLGKLLSMAFQDFTVTSEVRLFKG